MARYKLTKTGEGYAACVKKIVSANESIVFSVNAIDNPDYIEYKAWLDAGNTPEAAD